MGAYPNILSAKHQRSTLVADSIRNDDPTFVTASLRIPVSVLKILQLLSVTVPQLYGTRLHVHIVDVTCAIGEASDRIQQRRTDDVAYLKSGVVIAVSERRQFKETTVVFRCLAELLRENGVGDSDIAEFVSAVSDAQTAIVRMIQIVLEIGTDSLYRGRIHGHGIERGPETLHPDTPHQPDVMVSNQSKNSVEKTDRMRSLPSRTTGCIFANFGPFDLGQDPVQRTRGGIRQAREVALFQVQELVGEIGKACDINEESGDGEDRLVVWLRWIAECAEIPGLVYKANMQIRTSKFALPKSYDHLTVVIGSAARLGSAI